MVWEAVSAAIGKITDNIVAVIREFHLAPEEALKLEMSMRQQVMDFQREMLALELNDIQDARKREVSSGDPTVRRLAYLYTGGYFLSLFATWHWGIPTDGHDVFVTLLGVLTAAQASIIGYYFGSSQSSASKEKILDRVVNHKPSA